MNLDDFLENIKKIAPKTPIDWTAFAMAHLAMASELQTRETGVYGRGKNHLRRMGCDPVQHMNSLLDALDVLEDVRVQSCTAILACGCHLNNLGDEWAIDPCDAHIEALDSRCPITYWIQSEAGEEHITNPKTLSASYHKPFIPPSDAEMETIALTGDSSKIGRQFIHMPQSYVTKKDNRIAERLIGSVDDASNLD